jgi:hypothetical protein
MENSQPCGDLRHNDLLVLFEICRTKTLQNDH